MNTKKVAIVTGASSGIGKQIAKNLKRNGFEVYALARRVYKMNDLDDLGINTMYVDVADETSIEETVAKILAQTGRIDVLVNNAGYGSFGSVEDVPLAEGKHQFEVNVFGAMKMIQEVVPTMRAQFSGRIINISSVDGKIANLLGAWYVGTKFAIEGMSDALRLELSQFGIDVILIEPAMVKSNWSEIAIDGMKKVTQMTPYNTLGRQSADFFRVATKFASSPYVIARAVDRAALSKAPKTRYAVGMVAKTAVISRKLLPDKMLDRILLDLTKKAHYITNREVGNNR
ncbi:oxidoreductase [Lentilactobacillus laojiaonis]|uniref:oxidoreductase n=1 Tax=Lentilactobacillus laojiaonis TaxID=2883998 RepID=UPI001D09FB73|nr:oxidoreductase [Lentilactobacillus laojiaonis]UDM32051.1 SDR family NAD(P)-dependent oxidoreductase [Lentilactobacillus laojiaonis]